MIILNDIFYSCNFEVKERKRVTEEQFNDPPKWKFCHELLALISFQNHKCFIYLQNIFLMKPESFLFLHWKIRKDYEVTVKVTNESGRSHDQLIIACFIS